MCYAVLFQQYKIPLKRSAYHFLLFEYLNQFQISNPSKPIGVAFFAHVILVFFQQFLYHNIIQLHNRSISP